jgi:hypothetical protein
MQNISRAIAEIAYDNGAVNRAEDEESVMRRVFVALYAEFTMRTLNTVENRLSELSETELIVICTGEDTEAKAIYLRSDFPFSIPDIAAIEAVLETIFENI